MRGTSPKVWNAWKGKLLEDLYRLTLRALGGRAPDRDAEIEARKRERWPSCRAWPAARWRHRRCGRRWTWLLHAPRRRRHRLARPLALQGHASTTPRVRARARRWAKACRCWCTPAADDLFARICGYFDRAGFSIQDAKIHGTRDGWALDTFQVVSDLLPEGAPR
jgi:[protein-PII] uridylyltransferase